MLIKEGYISSSDMEVINREVMDESFPWYYCEESTTRNFPFLKHSLMSRWDKSGDRQTIDSSMYPFFEGILMGFCKENGIIINEILRASLNLTYYTSMHEFGDPHVDYPFETWQVLMYLNEFDNGETLIFCDEYGENGLDDCTIPISESGNLQVKIMIVPEKGKIAGVYGKNFHTSKWCSSGQRRVICVFVLR